MNKTFDQKEIDFHKEKILTDPVYFDSTLSTDFCIALQSIHIESMYLISENLSAIFQNAYKNNNTKWDILHIATKNYFDQYLPSKPGGIAEFLKLFLKDRNSTFESFKSFKKELKKIGELEAIHTFSGEEELKKIVGPFNDDVAEFRYFNNEMIRKYFFLAFCTKLNTFSKEEVQKGFEYFINILIPISEKYYNSGYVQYHTGIENLEEAIKSTRNNLGTSPMPSLLTKIISLIRDKMKKFI